MLELETSEVVPAWNLSSACLPCFVFFSPGLIAAPEEFLHLLKHACCVSFSSSFYLHIILAFVRLILTAAPTHGPVVNISQLLSAFVS